MKNFGKELHLIMMKSYEKTIGKFLMRVNQHVVEHVSPQWCLFQTVYLSSVAQELFTIREAVLDF